MTKFWRNVSLAIAVVMMSVSTIGAAVIGHAADEEAGEKQGTLINPIAKYEFKDASNHGKDSMGNYDLEFGRYWVGGGTGELMQDGTVDTENGGVTFNYGNGSPAATGYCLTNTEGADPFENLTAFTLAFEFKNNTNVGDWRTLIGWSSSNATNYLGLQVMADNKGAYNNVGFNCYGTGAGPIWGNAWFQNCGAINGDAQSTYQKMVISAQPGGKLMVFVNGKRWIDAEGKITENEMLAEDWNINSGNAQFAIGAEYDGHNGVYSAAGSIRNVQIYDFAMDATAAVAYQTNGYITTKDFSDIKEVLKAEATFEADQTTAPLNETMKAEEMFALLNTAKARLTLSDTSTVDVDLTWKNVTKEGEKYYAIGEFNIDGMGLINNVGNTVKYELEVLKVKSIGEPVFNGDALNAEVNASKTDAEILAAINKATVTVTLPDDSTTDVEVTFDELSVSLGDYVAYANVVVNEQLIGKVQYALDIEVSVDGVSFAPVAKWEFSDPENPGKDSMGKYNLTPAAKEGGDTSNPVGSGEVIDGKFYVNGDDCLTLPAMEDVGDTLDNGFTLNFQVQKLGEVGDWQCPVGFGFNDWNATKACWFLTGKGNGALRMGAQGITYDDKGAPHIYWAPVVAGDIRDSMHNVTLAARPGSYMNVYVDGFEVASYDCPEGWNINDANMAFSIGGACVWGNGYVFFNGCIDNVSIYNFAMTLDQSNAYWRKGIVLESDLNGEVITSIDPTPVFEGEILSKPLNDKLTDTQIISRVNDATAKAVLTNGNTISVAISWKTIEKAENGKYYVVGEVDTSNIGWASTLQGITEIRQEVEVTEVERAIVIDEDIENGTVVPSKTGALKGETVTFTITPAEGYQLVMIEVDGNEIFANEEGVYSYTVTGNSDIEVYAEFEEIPVTGCKSSVSGAGLVGLFLLSAGYFVSKKARKED